MAAEKNNKTLNVPTLRFPEFSGEWEKAILLDVCEINPKTPSLDEEFVYIDLESVEKGEILHENVISRDDAPSRAQRVLKFNDILFQCVRPYQKNNLLFARDTHTIQYVASTGYAQIRTDKQNPAFLYQLLNTQKFIDQVMLRCTGTSYPAINTNDLSKIAIRYPLQIEEQNKIAKLLSLLDGRIKTQKKVIEKYESLIRGISNKFLYTENGIPVRLGDILLERSERTKVNNQHEVLSSTVKGIFSQREYFSKEIASENNAGYKIIHLHDVVLSPQNLWMGNINYNDKYDIGIVSPSYKIFSIAEGYDKRFVSALLKTHRALYNYMLVSEQGASIVRRNLNMEAFEQLVFKMPPIDKQREVGDAISALQSRLELAVRVKTAYEKQKQWLLTEMFI